MSLPAESHKVHTAIGHARSLCGLSPQRGNYDVRSNEEFALVAKECQCGRCLHHLKKRGYSIQKIRAQAMFGRAIIRSDSHA